MRGYYLTKEELQVLFKAPALAQRLYLVLRANADREGRVGVSFRVSWQGFADRLTPPPRKGKAPEVVDRSSVRRAAEALESLGLIKVAGQRDARKLRVFIPETRTKTTQYPAENPAVVTTAETRAIAGLQRNGAPIPGLVPEQNGPIPGLDDAQYPAEFYTQYPNESEQLEPHVARVFAVDSEPKPGLVLGTLPEQESDQYPANISRLDRYRLDKSASHLSPQIHQLSDDHKPTTAREWSLIFQATGYNPGQSFSVKVAKLYNQWIDQQITLGEVRQAIEIATGNLGELPGSPLYLSNIVQQLRAPEPKKQSGANHGPQTNQQSGRKLSARDRVYAANGIDVNSGRFLDE